MPRLIFLLSILTCFGAKAQYEYLLDKNFEQRFEAFDSLFYVRSFWAQPDKKKIYARFEAIRTMAKKAGDEELLMEVTLAECNYWQYGMADKVGWYQTGLYSNIQNSDRYLATLDTLIYQAKRKNIKQIRARAHLLCALEYHAREDFDKSLAHLMKFYRLVNEMDEKEFPIKKRLFLFLGKMYYSYGDYYGAERHLRAGIPSRKTHQSDEDIDIYNTLGLVKRQENEYDSALYYFFKARELAGGQQKKDWVSVLDGNIGIVHYLDGAYEKAKPLLLTDVDKSLARKDFGNAINSVIKLADLYHRLNNNDSAWVFAGIARSIIDSVSPSFRHRVALYKLLSQLAYQKGDRGAAYLFSDSALAANDSLASSSHLQSLMRTRQQLEHSLYNTEINRLEAEKRISLLQRNSLLGGLILLAALAILIVYTHNRQRKATRQLAETRLENARRRLAEFTKTVQEKNRLLETSEQEIIKLRELLNKTDNYQLEDTVLQLQSSTILTEEEWDDFRQMFELVHSGFLYRLREKFPNLSPAETRIIALAKLRLDNKEMAGMMGIGVSTIRNHKFRLRKKLGILDEDAFSSLIHSI